MQQDEFQQKQKKPYELISFLGQGGYAEVIKVKKTGTNEYYALKRIKLYRLNDPKIRRQMEVQVQLMKEMDHPNIIKLVDSFQDQEHFNMVLELAEGGCLYDRLQQVGRLSESKVISYIKQVVAALTYLHERPHPILHRDLKPENILIDSTGRCKLGDFGCSNVMHSGTRDTYAGTQIYMAPEVISNLPYNESVDLWNLGVMIYELLAGKNPFVGRASGLQDIQSIIINEDIQFPETFPPLARDVVRRLLQKVPNERMTLKQLKNHVWMTLDLEQPMIKTYYAPQNNRKIEKAQQQVKKYNEKFQQVRRRQEEIGQLRQQIKKIKKEKLIKVKKFQFNTKQYFELSDTLAKMKSQYAENQKKLQARHKKLILKTQKIQQMQDQVYNEIQSYRQKIAELEHEQLKPMAKIRHNFNEANNRLNELIQSVERFPEKLREELLYRRDSKVKAKPAKGTLELDKLLLESLKEKKYALEAKKSCLTEEINRLGYQREQPNQQLVNGQNQQN